MGSWLTDLGLVVEAGFGSSHRTDPAAVVWTDITADVKADAGVRFTRGRQGGWGSVSPGTCRLSLRNLDGTYTPSLTAHPAGAFRLDDPALGVLDTGGALAAYVNSVGTPLRVRVTGAATATLWTGYVTDWSAQWEGAAAGTATVAASDLLAFVGGVLLRDAVQAEILSDGPVALWPLGDSAGSTTAGDATPSAYNPLLTVAQVGSGGFADFGAATSPGPDEGTSLALTPVDASNGKQLTGSLVTTDAAGVTVEAYLRPRATAAREAVRTTGAWTIALSSSAAGKAVLTVTHPSGTATVTGTTTLPTIGGTGAWTHVAATISISGSTATATLYVAGVSEGTPATFTATVVPAASSVTVGGLAGSLWDGDLAHVALHAQALTAARLLEHAGAANGWAGESSDARFDRICCLAGLPAGTYSASGGVATMSAQPMAARGLVPLLDEVAAAELGTRDVAGDGTLRLRNRTARYNAAVAATLNATRDVTSDFAGFTMNTQDLVNDVTVTRPGGATVRVTDTDSVALYGAQAEDATLYVNSDTQAEAAAAWLSHNRSQPLPRTSAITVDVDTALAQGTADDVLALDTGSRITVTNLPTAAPASSMDLFVEGLAHDIGKNSWRVTLDTSPVGASGAVFQLDSTTYGVLDTTAVLAA